MTRSGLKNRKIVAFAQDRRPPERLSGIYEIASKSRHDFTPLEQHYPNIIAALPDTFTSHDFIQALSQWHQTLYNEALHAYRDVQGPHNSPTQVVHGILAVRLHRFPDLVEYIGKVPSTDLFGNRNNAAEWRKR